MSLYSNSYTLLLLNNWSAYRNATQSTVERCRSVVVSMSACHTAGRGSLPGPGALLGHLALYIRDCSLNSDETLKAVGPSGVYAREGKISHQSALEMCNLSWTPHSSLEKDNSLNHSCVSPKMGCLEYT